MSLAGVSNEDFEEFKSNIFSRILDIESNIQQRPEEAEQQAITAAASAATHAQQAQSSAEAIQTLLNDCNDHKITICEAIKELEDERLSAEKKNATLTEQISVSQRLYDQFIEAKKAADLQIEDLSAKVNQANQFLDETSELPNAIKQTTDLLEKSKLISEDIKSLFSHSTSRKSEIDELHQKILGKDIEGTNGEVEHIDGMKDELNKAYLVLNEQTKNLTDRVEKLALEISNRHTIQLRQLTDKFDRLLLDSTTRYESVNKELTSLLPGAMAEGLSAAYEKKKQEESKSHAKFENEFKFTITILFFIALLPFSVNYDLFKNHGWDLVQVINGTPHLMMAIFPIYFPVIWLAYSTNKKINLSKRLIEEYTHKSALGKTFSGLSNQIETLPHQSAVKEELRTRLLFNVLQVSAENPGKLITDYNKADHPIMDALEKSGKLAESMDAISKIPGFSSIAKRITDRVDREMASKTEKIDKGLKDQAAINTVNPTEPTGEVQKTQ